MEGLVTGMPVSARVLPRALVSAENAVVLLLIVLSLHDLFGPLTTTATVWRQTQTAMLTENFVRERFSMDGLFVTIDGDRRPLMVYEFPIYNFVVGLFYIAFGVNAFWGKFVSLIASIAALLFLMRLVRRLYGRTVALWTALAFVASPIVLMMTSSYQPDALALAAMLWALTRLLAWRERPTVGNLALLSIAYLIAALIKFPVLVPYGPLAVAAMLTNERGFRRPRWTEVAVVVFLFVLPLVAWFVYRGGIIDPLFASRGDEVSMFLFGDLQRFANPSFYFKPLMAFTVLLLSGTGFLIFLAGCARMNTFERLLLLGIPFYFVLIPTVSDQYYYLFACAPIVAIFVAKGTVALSEFVKNRGGAARLLPVAAIVSYSIVFVIAINWVLRRDAILAEAAIAVREATAPEDLVFSINMHERGLGIGGKNPAMFYLAGRRGWNLQYASGMSTDDVREQIESRRGAGAEWCVITWYTADREPWFSKYLPRPFRREPDVDGRLIFQALQEEYALVRSGANYAVLRL